MLLIISEDKDYCTDEVISWLILNKEPFIRYNSSNEYVKQIDFKISNRITDVKIKKKQIWAEEIKGICYYIDDTNNIYDHEDIIKNKENPKIIANYKVDFEGKYSIPEYGI